jgi:PTH1 family peptidyl-tRNA hydrolase
MKVIAGLGNPGLRYRGTRHNAGFMVIDSLAKKHGIRVRQKAFGGVYGSGRIAGEEVLLFKPLTYMNLSGEAVKSVLSRHLEYKGDLLVVVDDFNIPLGSFRLREKGSAGGHNGLESLIGHIGGDFARLRVGIGSEGMPAERSGYVLSPFTRAEKRDLDGLMPDILACVETWLAKGPVEAMRLSSRGCGPDEID